ncbi:hypothetical protein FRB91_001442 [Serendipita sp. 411]|nr:hypothetical protein FRC18_003749 [Serendipita sp. 400]KAG8855969.1 hypothetical protein FRB91_001442 [Serendipita sp. 411]
MRCYVSFLSLVVLVGLLESGKARVVVNRRQEPSGTDVSTVVGSQSTTSETPTSSQPVTTSSSISPPGSSQPTILASETSVVTVPSITLQSTPSVPSGTSTPVPDTPAGFFGNRTAILLLGACLAGIGGIIVLFALWINFRRSWYFPWNRNKQHNNPSRWSVYSFREKPQLPLGRQPAATVSTEHFAKTNESNDGHLTQHMHELDSHLPPIPEIRIDSPRSAYSADRRLGPKMPPGLGHHTRWSSATSHVSAGSIYSQPSVTFREDAQMADRYSSGEEPFYPRSATRVTSDSSDNSPFRFDTHSQSFGSRSTPLRRATLDVDDNTWKGHSRMPLGDGWRAAKGGNGEPTDPVEYTLWQLSGRGEVSRAGPSSALREVSRFSADDDFDAPKDGNIHSSPSKGVDEGPGRYGLAPQRGIAFTYGDSNMGKALSPIQGIKPMPKGILKTPHYQTTSARLARNRSNKI